MERVDVVIIGAGIAGVSTAFYLARRGVTSVLILEKEPVPAPHSSGKNAALFYQTDAEPFNVELAMESRRLYVELEPEDGPLVRPTGSLTLSESDQKGQLLERARRDRSLGVKLEILTAGEARLKVPPLHDDAFSAAVWAPQDGVIDIHGLVQRLLKGALAQGAQLRLGCEVKRIMTRSGRAQGVETEEGVVEAGIVVNAAGAWAVKLATRSGGSVLPLRPCRRHLMVSQRTDLLPSSAPIVWDQSRGCYFRPESGAVLMNPCDEDPVDPDSLIVSPGALEKLATKLEELAPALARVGIVRTWACVRTLTPDGLCSVGEDPAVKGLFWVAGLGGHGMTCGPAIGSLAAEAIAGVNSPPLRQIEPARFTQQ